MVHFSKTLALAFLLVTPSLAIPVSQRYDLQAREVEIDAREPSFGSWFRRIKKKFVNPISKIANTVVKDVGIAKKLINPVSQIANTVGSSGILKREDLEALEELAARDPSFGSFLKKVKKAANPFQKLATSVVKDVGAARKFIGPATQIASTVGSAGLLKREDLEALEELAARDPSFGSFLRRVKKAANPFQKIANTVVKDVGVARKLINPVSQIANTVGGAGLLKREDIEALEELAARDPSFGSFLRRVKKAANPLQRITNTVVKDVGVAKKLIGPASQIASTVGSAGLLKREDSAVLEFIERDFDDEMFERAFGDLEFDELD